MMRERYLNGGLLSIYSYYAEGRVGGKAGKEFPAQTYTFAPSFLFVSLWGVAVAGSAS
jgi:hypothetical protein